MRHLLALTLLACVGCEMSAAERRALTDRFAAATCVPPTIHPDYPPGTRAWQAELRSDRGAQFRIDGAQWIGRGVALFFAPDGAIKSIGPGDYIYPSDVRF